MKRNTTSTTVSHELPSKKQKSNFAVKQSYNELQRERQKLPIFGAKHRLLKELSQLDNAIVIGETGSGKTTQIPQYICRAAMHRKRMIACTQPRRVAAMTVAQRVSNEMGSQLGAKVGYSVRFDDMTSEHTVIKYMTDGMLLREAVLDPLMKRYSIVILDEAHERTIHTDVLFGVVKSAQKQRKRQGMLPLKIIVMSATMDVDHFSQYFNQAPVLYLEGRQYPVKVMYSCESQSDYLFASMVTAFQIHQEAPPDHDILIFLTGQEEIESAVRSMKLIARDLPTDSVPMLVLPLYAALPSVNQLKVFQPAPKGTRKVILSTNIAETSVTIHGIKHVIDCGKVKAKSFNAGSGLDLLKVQSVSQAQAWQRTGRAGRESAGTSYRLYTEQEFEHLKKNSIPEIQRCNLASVVLQLLALGIKDLIKFDFMDKPAPQTIIHALQELHILGAVTKADSIQLTPLGSQMAAFPLDPRYSKTILIAKDYNCLEEILIIVSMLSVESVLHTPQSKREEALAARQKFISSEGDHITLLNIYRSYKSASGNKQWCQENFINGRNMKTATEVRRQLRAICVQQQLPIQSSGHDTTCIRKCLAHGFFMNTAELKKEGEYISIPGRKTVAIHPSSALFQSKPSVVIYNQLIQTTKCYMRDLTVVDVDWLYDAAPTFFKKKHLAR